MSKNYNNPIGFVTWIKSYSSKDNGNIVHKRVFVKIFNIKYFKKNKQTKMAGGYFSIHIHDIT
jgi:hypothetical protein